MSYYEILYIISPVLSEAEREELIKKLDDFVASKGGEVIAENRWGTRTLAYPIKKHSTGYYVLTYVSMPEENLKDLRYFMRINEGFLREMILKKKSVPSNLKKKEHSAEESASQTENEERETAKPEQEQKPAEAEKPAEVSEADEEE